MPTSIPPKAVIFDLGDVLFTWSPDTKTAIPAQTMRYILSSSTWHKYECGLIDEATCYHQVAKDFSVPVAEVDEAFSQARASLQPNNEMMSFIRELKKACCGTVRFYAMSNISIEDWAILRTKMADWSVFDRVFASGHAGMRKPDLPFYQHVLDQINTAPQDVIFIDDKTINVLAAQRLGIRGFAFRDNPRAIQNLKNTFESSVGRGYRYLRRNAQKLESVTATGVKVPENFSQLLILETLQDPHLVSLEKGPRPTWNFFKGEPTLIPGGYFSDDLDTTSLALTVLRPPQSVVSPILDKMLEYVNPDGTILTYFDKRKPRHDPIVYANVLACFHTFNRSHQLPPTVLTHILSFLTHRNHLKGTRYYSSPDCCLYFIARLLRSAVVGGDEVAEAHLRVTLLPLLRVCVRERMGAQGSSALDLAVRVRTCQMLEMEGEGGVEGDVQALRAMQREDRGWEGGALYRYGSSGLDIENRGVTTAWAVSALAAEMGVGEAFV